MILYERFGEDYDEVNILNIYKLKEKRLRTDFYAVEGRADTRKLLRSRVGKLTLFGQIFNFQFNFYVGSLCYLGRDCVVVNISVAKLV